MMKNLNGTLTGTQSTVIVNKPLQQSVIDSNSTTRQSSFGFGIGGLPILNDIVRPIEQLIDEANERASKPWNNQLPLDTEHGR